jgi:hypothetical protein
VIAFLTFLLALYAAAVSTALWAGLGLCQRCGAMCPPWRAHCWRHTPDP